MLSPKQFFSQMLQLETPFTLDRVETVMSRTTIQEVILHVSVPSDYRPEVYEYLHSTHHRRWQHLHSFQYPCFIQGDIPVYQRKWSLQPIIGALLPLSSVLKLDVNCTLFPLQIQGQPYGGALALNVGVHYRI